MKNRDRGTHAYKKQWLLSYQEMVEKAEYELKRAQYWKDRATGLSAYHISQIPSKSANKLEMDDCITKFLELSNRCELLAAEASERKQEIIDSIENVTDTECRRLLYLYYIEGLKLRDIAEKMHYSFDWIKRLHIRALGKIKVPQLKSTPKDT